MTDMIYDVVIVGAGPAGLWSALELAGHGNILLMESVRRLHDTRNVSNGFMGGSAKSDVNLFIEPGYGGFIKNASVFEKFLDYLQHYNNQSVKIKKYSLPTRMFSHFENHNVKIDQPSVVHVNADRFTNIELGIKKFLDKNIAFRPDCHLIDLYKENKIFNIKTSNGTIYAKQCILALGRGGGFFLKNASILKEFTYSDESFDLGVRLEFPNSVIKHYIEKSPYFRLKWDDYRTSSFTIKGFVEMDDVFDIKTSNGRSIKNKLTYSSNVGLLKTFKTNDALNKVSNLVQIANILGDGQLLKDPVNRVLNNKWVLGPVPEFASLIDGISKMVEVFPELKQKGYVYSPEARINTFNFKLNKNMETEVKNLYIVGDMSGATNSFVQAACSGLIAAKHILSK